jgi:anthranilate phosphoribosyltransferase
MASIESTDKVLITSLLKRLWPNPKATSVTAEEIAQAVSHIFKDQLSPVQTGALLTALHFTGWDTHADVIALCAKSMREAAQKPDLKLLSEVVNQKGRKEGSYHGGLVSTPPER